MSQLWFSGYVKPEVIWLRGNTPLPKSSPRFKYIEDSNNLHTLILSGVTAEEAGKYTCRVSNEYGYTETFARVDVINVSSGAVKHEKPAMFLTRPDTMMSVALGEDISFSFRLAGSPKPKGNRKFLEYYISVSSLIDKLKWGAQKQRTAK